MKMRVADYMLKYFDSIGTKTVFGITGSAIATVFDSFSSNKKVKLICSQHEQGSAFAAHAYAQVSGRLGVAIATSGPGSTNLITGIGCSWFDSVPTLYITGQINSRFVKGDKPVRQIGFQETDIVEIVRSITKYAVMIKDPNLIRYELEKATYLAKSGRPGPSLIDIPMDIQKAEIDDSNLKPFIPELTDSIYDSSEVIRSDIRSFLKDLNKAERPVILLGGGVVYAGVVKEVRELISKLKIPVVVTWPAIDLLEETHPLYCGRIGTYGQRGANFTLQNADLLLSLGSRHDGRQTGGRVDSFAREARRYVVDIDRNELIHQPVKCHVNINADLKDFMTEFLKISSKYKFSGRGVWLKKAKSWQKEFPTVDPEYKKVKKGINGYVLMDTLSGKLSDNDIVVGDCGGNIVYLAQAFKRKKGQRIITSWSNSPMGYSFAASVGAYYGAFDVGRKGRVVCIVGDGGMQVNIQELQTVKSYNLPLTILVANNFSYGIIKQYQDIYLSSRYVDSDDRKGYGVPDFVKIAKAYGINADSVKNIEEFNKKLIPALHSKWPILLNIHMPDKTVLVPRLGWDSGIEDQFPPLDRKKFFDHLYIKPLDSQKTGVGNQP